MFVSKIEQKQNPAQIPTTIESENQKLERFSSQGQEELLQAYQLPTVYSSQDGKPSTSEGKQRHSVSTFVGRKQNSNYKSQENYGQFSNEFRQMTRSTNRHPGRQQYAGPNHMLPSLTPNEFNKGHKV